MTTTLYERLGGGDAIRQLASDVIDAHLNNPVIRQHFQPCSADPHTLEKVRSHVYEFFAAGGGGDVEYAGRSMPEAHRGMDINAAEFMSATDDVLANGNDEPTCNEVLGILYSLKDDVMHL